MRFTPTWSFCNFLGNCVSTDTIKLHNDYSKTVLHVARKRASVASDRGHLAACFTGRITTSHEAIVTRLPYPRPFSHAKKKKKKFLSILVFHTRKIKEKKDRMTRIHIDSLHYNVHSCSCQSTSPIFPDKQYIVFHRCVILPHKTFRNLYASWRWC